MLSSFWLKRALALANRELNFLLNYPYPNSVDSRIFKVGDTKFSAQGVALVILGAMNCLNVGGR